QGSPEALMQALQTFWSRSGSSPMALSDLLNNIQQPAGYNPLLGPSANNILAQGGQAGGGGGGFQAGSGFATSPAATAVGIFSLTNGVQLGNTGTGSPETLAANISQYNSMMQQEAKDLANSVSLASLSWSSISDFSKQSENSI